jgi:hypothetical protein
MMRPRLADVLQVRTPTFVPPGCWAASGVTAPNIDATTNISGQNRNITSPSILLNIDDEFMKYV